MTAFKKRTRSGWPGYLLVAALVTVAPLAFGAEIAECRVGFGGTYKVGHWTPVWVEIRAAGALVDGHVDVTTRDSDGVPVTYTLAVPKSDSPAGSATVELAVQVGRMASTLHIVLRDGKRETERVEVSSGPASHNKRAFNDLPATGELIVAVGSMPFGMEKAFPPRDAPGGTVVRRAIQLGSVADLPTTWFGYDAVDVLVLSVGDGALARDLANDSMRLAALRKWVELGGRLVILCGGNAAKELLPDHASLAALLPGKYVGATMSTTQTERLEHFAESSDQIAGERGRAELLVPRLADVTGPIEAYAGQQPSDLPLVVRGALGLGEVAFAGVDLSAPPLADWAGRTAFLHALLRPYVAKTEAIEAPQALMTLGYDDLSGALRQRLGSSFAGVRTLSFPAVAALAIAFLLLLGPGDWWLVNKVLRRPGAAWITFPVLVVATCWGAYALADWSKGAGGARVNQVQLTDFDATTGRVRGTHWATLFTPQSRRFDLSLSPPVGTLREDDALLSCWGLTGAGIGGMDARNVGLGGTQTGYRMSPALDVMEAVPLLTASTKSLVARTTAAVKSPLEVQLRELDDLPVGTITNRSEQPLRNVRLLYGTWAYRLGALSPGQQVEIGPHLDAIQVRTMVARSAGISAEQLSGEAERAVFYSDRASVEELLNLMMFYNASGGPAFAQLPSRFQDFCDLSRLLTLGRAIVVAEVAGPVRPLVDDGQPLDNAGTSLVVVRCVARVERSE